MKTRQKAKPCENVPPEEPINFEDPDVDIQLPETATVEKVTSFMDFLLKYFYIAVCTLVLWRILMLLPQKVPQLQILSCCPVDGTFIVP